MPMQDIPYRTCYVESGAPATPPDPFRTLSLLGLLAVRRPVTPAFSKMYSPIPPHHDTKIFHESLAFFSRHLIPLSRSWSVNT